jgi:hypothetical protein
MAGWNQVTAKPLASPAEAFAPRASKPAIAAAEQKIEFNRAIAPLPKPAATLLPGRIHGPFILAEI